MKYTTKSITIEVEQYTSGMEDGFSCYGDGRERKSKPPLCNLNCEKCVLSGDMGPYVLDGEDKTDIHEGDFIITDDEGKKSVLNPKELDKYFEPEKVVENAKKSKS